MKEDGGQGRRFAKIVGTSGFWTCVLDFLAVSGMICLSFRGRFDILLEKRPTAIREIPDKVERGKERSLKSMIRFKMRFRELITTFVFLSRSASFFTVTAAESKALIRDIQTGYLLNCSFRAIRPYPWKKLPLLSGGWETCFCHLFSPALSIRSWRE